MDNITESEAVANITAKVTLQDIVDRDNEKRMELFKAVKALAKNKSSHGAEIS